MPRLCDSPCRDCDKRYLGCHADCKHYAAYSARTVAVRNERLHDAEMAYAAREVARKKAKRHTNKWGGEG